MVDRGDLLLGTDALVELQIGSDPDSCCLRRQLFPPI